MRALSQASAVWLGLVIASAAAHGPQIQITRHNDTITTRRLLLDEPYSAGLTPETRAYVIPLLETQGVWYARPNTTPSSTLPGLPKYLSGPGITYGYDQAEGSVRAFAATEHFRLNIVSRLLRWDGASFVDPGLEEIEVYRSTGATATTSDALTPGAPAILPFGNISPSYNANAHGSASLRLLGDGVSQTAASDDGVYLLSLVLSSTEPGLGASDPFSFVLHKNAAQSEIAAAVGSLSLAPTFVQYVPEPGCGLVAAVAVATLAAARTRTRSAR